MKVLSVCGITQSGKTTTVEQLIKELKARGHRVGSVKEIHAETFAIDPNPKSNTHRHRKAGAELVTARGYFETDLLFPEKLPMAKILSFYEGYDWVVLEGVDDIPVPTIVTAHTEEDLAEKWSAYSIAVSGRLSAQIDSYQGMPAINALTDAAALADLAEARVYDLLPNFDADCCTACGHTCQSLGEEILRGNAKRSDCVADKGVSLEVDGQRVNMVPFVQKILQNAVLGVVGELDGYHEGADVVIKL